MKKEIHACDVCGVERKDANHWFIASKHSAYEALAISPWSEMKQHESATNTTGLKHICGQVCAHKLLDQFLSGELK